MTGHTKKWPPVAAGGQDEDKNPGRNVMSTAQGSAVLARSTDPDTSHEGAKHARRAAEAQKQAIIWLLKNLGPMTDHQLTYEYEKHRTEKRWPATQRDGVRKRRAELKNDGRVFDTGTRSGFVPGNPPSIVWAATADEGVTTK